MRHLAEFDEQFAAQNRSQQDHGSVHRDAEASGRHKRRSSRHRAFHDHWRRRRLRTVTDYRTVKGHTALIRRVAVGNKGTITFLITINLNTGSEPWTITSATKSYAGLHGKGTEIVDNYNASPATFALRGTVSQ